MLLSIQPDTTMSISLIMQAGIIIIRVGIHPGTTGMRMLRPELYMKMGGAIQVSILPGGGDRYGTLHSILVMAGTVIRMGMDIMGIMGITDILAEEEHEVSVRDAIRSWHAVLERDMAGLQFGDSVRHLLQAMYRQGELKILFQETVLHRMQQTLQDSTVHQFVNRSIRIK